MAQSSILWSTTGVGHGLLAGYSQAQVTEWMRLLAAGLTGADLSGVGPDYQNELAVTGTVSPVAVNTGGAFVYGYPHFNTASENIVVPTPSVSTRIDRIVLEVNWAAQTVLLARVAGTEGAGAPSLTQTAGTTWQMALAQVSITTGGVITVTDQREWLSVVGDGSVSVDKLATNAVTTVKIADSQITLGKMADNSVGTSELVDLNVTTGKLADLAVTTGKIADSQITLSKMADASVGTAEIVDLAVTSGKLADGAVLAEILDDDGAGSGLDADLLDGVQGSGYSITSHNHTFDSLSNVSMGAKAVDDFPQWNGTNWIPTAVAPGGVNFNDAEGNSADVTTAAADGTSANAARRDHAHALANDVVTFAKMQNIVTDSLIGRDTASTGDPENITLNATLSMTGAGALQRAALTGDVTASAGSNAMAIAADVIEYTDMRAQYANPIVVYGLGANQDFTTIVTADFDTLSLDYDGPGIISNDGAGIFTFSVACYIEVTVSGFVGHATGTTEAWCNVFIENGTSGGSYSSVGRTSRIFYIPGTNWNGFHVACVSSRGAGEKLRVRIERAAGTDSLRLSTDSAIIIKVIA